MRTDLFRKATADAAVHAIDNLIEILRDACQCLIEGNHNGAAGSLLSFDDNVEDMKAAIRLHRSVDRRGAVTEQKAA